MFGSFQKLVSILYRINGFDVTLKPNVTVLPSADRVIELPAVDLDCVLLSRGEADADYQPLSTELSAIAALAGPGFVVNDGASGAFARSIEAATDAGLSVSNGDGVVENPKLSLSLANLQSETATLSDKMIFGDVSASDAPKYLTIQDLADLVGPGAYGYAATWDNDTTSIVIEHNLDSEDVMVQLYDVASRDSIMIDQMYRVDGNSIQLLASEAPPSGTGWRVLVQKIA
jgi:hypothetical protein